MKTAEKSLKRRTLMQFALLIYHTPEEFAIRKNDYNIVISVLGVLTTRRWLKLASTSPAIHWKCPKPERPCVSEKENGACRMDPTQKRRSS